MQTSTPVLCSPEYLRRYGLPRTVDNLKKHTGLLLKTKTHLLTRFLYKGSQQSNLLQWKTLFLTHDQLAIKRLLLNHQGITTDLYFGHLLEEIKNGDLVPILPGWERSPWIMSLVTRRDRDLENSELRKFADWWAQSEADSALDRVVKGRRIIEQAQRNAAELLNPYLFRSLGLSQFFRFSTSLNSRSKKSYNLTPILRRRLSRHTISCYSVLISRIVDVQGI